METSSLPSSGTDGAAATTAATAAPETATTTTSSTAATAATTSTTTTTKTETTETSSSSRPQPAPVVATASQQKRLLRSRSSDLSNSRNVIRMVHSMLANFVSDWLAAFHEHAEMPRLSTLDLLRKSCVDTIVTMLRRNVASLEEKKKKDAAADKTTGKLMWKKEMYWCYLVAVLLNFVSYLEELEYKLDKEPADVQAEQRKYAENAVVEMERYLSHVDVKNKEKEVLKDHLIPFPMLLVPKPGLREPFPDRACLLAFIAALQERYFENENKKPTLSQMKKLLNMATEISTIWPPPLRTAGSSSSSSASPRSPISTIFGRGKSSSKGGGDGSRANHPEFDKEEAELFDKLLHQPGQLEDQRFEMTEARQREMSLNEVIDAVDRLGHHGRMMDQVAEDPKERKEGYERELDAIVERISKTSAGYDDQRYTMTADKLKAFSMHELLQSVERLAEGRMENQDAMSNEERQKHLLNVVGDVVEKMRAHSLDDQRFIKNMADRLKMTPEDLRRSVENVPGVLHASQTAAAAGVAEKVSTQARSSEEEQS